LSGEVTVEVASMFADQRSEPFESGWDSTKIERMGKWWWWHWSLWSNRGDWGQWGIWMRGRSPESAMARTVTVTVMMMSR
jgi:hypothetical protein